MTPTKGIDVSVYQGSIDWSAVKVAGYEIGIIKVSGGDAGLYMDSKCGINYNGARNAGLSVGTYHFAGGGDPIAEADYFLRVCAPLDENQVLILDWEIQHANPVDWVGQFVQHVHDSCGVWPIVYMNGSTANAYNWNGDARVANCGKWIAWYGVDPNSDLAVHEPYIAHQYSSSGSVPGIAGNVDLSDWWIDVPTFNKYGYHAPVAPPPTPAPAPSPPPAPLPPTVTASTGPDSTVTITPAPPAPVTQTTVNTNTPDSTDSASTLPSTSTTHATPPHPSWWARLLAWLKTVITIRKA